MSRSRLRRDRDGSLQGLLGILLAGATVPLLLASIVVGVRSLHDELEGSAWTSGQSVFPRPLRAQVDVVRESIAPDRGIILIATAANAWNARLWQRALYPRTVVVQYEPVPTRAELAALRRLYTLDFAVSLGSPPGGLSIAWNRDLGPDWGRSEHVWLGTLGP